MTALTSCVWITLVSATVNSNPRVGSAAANFGGDEIAQFINGHTGDSTPGMNRPTPAQVSQVLDQATLTPITGQAAEEFVATVNGDKDPGSREL